MRCPLIRQHHLCWRRLRQTLDSTVMIVTVATDVFLLVCCVLVIRCAIRARRVDKHALYTGLDRKIRVEFYSESCMVKMESLLGSTSWKFQVFSSKISSLSFVNWPQTQDLILRPSSSHKICLTHCSTGLLHDLPYQGRH